MFSRKLFGSCAWKRYYVTKAPKLKLLAFDIECPQDLDTVPIANFTIGCAATVKNDGEKKTWLHKTQTGEVGKEMSKEEVIALVEYLHSAFKEGYKIITWNGLGFDFRVLAKESEMVSKCADLALNHFDLMFHTFCLKGYCLGLNSVATGAKIEVKSNIYSFDVSATWDQGQEQRQQVLKHVLEDASATLDLFEFISQKKKLVWITEKKTPAQMSILRPMTVTESLSLPRPDTSWMKSGVTRTREEFMDWINISNNEGIKE
jgi:hypothetical protein